MDAEQIVRLTAAVLWETGRARLDGEDTRDALTLRLADAVGIALATEPAPAAGPRDPRPNRGPRGTSKTRGLWVKDYPARIAATPASSPTPSSSPVTAEALRGLERSYASRGSGASTPSSGKGE